MDVIRGAPTPHNSPTHSAKDNEGKKLKQELAELLQENRGSSEHLPRGTLHPGAIAFIVEAAGYRERFNETAGGYLRRPPNHRAHPQIWNQAVPSVGLRNSHRGPGNIRRGPQEAGQQVPRPAQVQPTGEAQLVALPKHRLLVFPEDE